MMARFTRDEDVAIMEVGRSGGSFRELALRLDRSRSGVNNRYAVLQKQGLRAVGPPKPRRWVQGGWTWTLQDDTYLRAYWGIKRDILVAEGLQRSVKACAARAYVLGFHRRDNAVTSADVARLFAVETTTVLDWIAKGMLKAGYRPALQGRGRGRHISTEAVEEFLDKYVHPLDITRMPEGHWLTAYAKKVLGDDEWLTLGQAAEEVHYSQSSLRKWIQKGMLQRGNFLRCSKGTPIMVRRIDLMAAAARSKI